MSDRARGHDSISGTGRRGGPSPSPLAGHPAGAPSIVRQAYERFRRHRLAMVSSAALGVFIALALAAPIIQRYPPNAIDLGRGSLAPSLVHWLGTDTIGRDIWSRALHGARVSLAIGLLSTLISMTLGITVGALSGYYLGWVDMFLQRVTDVVMTFPSIVLMMTLVVFVGPGVTNTILIIGGVSWMGVARLARAEFLTLREQVYVEAARCLGAPDRRIMWRHLLPNAIAPVLAQGAFGVGQAILTEAGLSFLGLGVPLPTPSWGNMLEPAIQLQILRNAPWIWVPPAVLIVLTVLCVNFIGDGARDALDPRTLRGA